MRFLSLTLCAATLACVAAQAAPEQQQQQAAFDVVGNQENYAWAASSSPEELALKADQLAAYVSEISFRAELLDSLSRDYEATATAAAGIDCSEIKDTLSGLLEGILTSTKSLTSVPFVGSVFAFVISQLESLRDAVANLSATTATLAAGIDTAFSSLRAVLAVIQFTQSPSEVTNVIKSIVDAESVIYKAVSCVVGGSKMAITQAHCAPTADLYRLLVEDASSKSPVLLDTASEEWKRIAAGASSVLELSKNAIAKSNEGLLSTRPIFVADLLNQYRDEYIRVAETDDAKIYAQSYLAAIVGISNALEACLRVAADPAVAAQELQEDLSAQARFEDENDEDEDEDEDEDQ
ncbi:hypothetical protein BGZ95_010598 [Linnemannia exigua]|uniref:Uncharacterized protein n=1 Tax=Linnemannia exigua TaxID=604196 RepID=A0AAD4DD49_9FUNG|nr:hypothetical protein BGZ95_010598 [Linnemannia exigua]